MRLELQIRGDSANAVLRDLMESNANWAPVALRHLVGFLDFRVEGSYRSHVERRTRCRWWADFVGCAEKATISRPEPQSLEAWRESFKRQNAGGFSVLVEMCRGDLEEAGLELLGAVPKRPNPKHTRMRDRVRLQNGVARGIGRASVMQSGLRKPHCPVTIGTGSPRRQAGADGDGAGGASPPALDPEVREKNVKAPTPITSRGVQYSLVGKRTQGSVLWLQFAHRGLEGEKRSR